PTPEMKMAQEILDLMIQERRKLAPSYNPISGGQIREHSLNHLAELLKTRSVEEIQRVILWGINKPFWCNRIGTPSKLRKHYDEALTEMLALQTQTGGGEENREWIYGVKDKADGNLSIEV